MRLYERDLDRAERLIRHAEPGPNYVAVDPSFDTLRANPRWPELIRRLGTQR